MLMRSAQEVWCGPPRTWGFIVTELCAKKCCDHTVQPAPEGYESNPKLGWDHSSFHQIISCISVSTWTTQPAPLSPRRRSHVNHKGGFVQSVFDLFWRSRGIQCNHLFGGNSELIPAEQQWVQALSHVMQLRALTCPTCLSAWQRLRLKRERVSAHKGPSENEVGFK